MGFPPKGAQNYPEDYSLKEEMLRIVIWQLFWEIWAKKKNFLRLNHRWYYERPCIYKHSHFISHKWKSLMAGMTWWWWSGKVQLFWECHDNLQNHPYSFDICLKVSLFRNVFWFQFKRMKKFDSTFMVPHGRINWPLVNVKTMRMIAQIFAAFSEKLNFQLENFQTLVFLFSQNWKLVATQFSAGQIHLETA